MSKATLPTIFSSLILYTASSYSEMVQEEKDCIQSSRPYHASVSHIEGKGIGYNQGYTSLDLFFSHLFERSLPFLDLRGHVFDDGRMAANAGIGYRHLSEGYVFGANAFYDYRSTSRSHYNQIGVGFEVLAKRWDFRLNGYLPVGTKQTSWYHKHFDGFHNHSMLIKQKQAFSMRGLNAEAGVYSDKIRSFWFYGGLGPYYYEGKGKNAYGGRLRINANYKSYISLELSGSYDNVFKDVFQAELSFNLPFGGKQSHKQKGSASNCNRLNVLMERLVQPVVRNEIIVTDHRHKTIVAENPDTHSPYYFIFVDNTSHSNGTFESPYPTLATALENSSSGDIIYIFPGDGTATGLTTDSTFQLLDSQQILGAGYGYQFSTQVGNITVPSMASGLPYLLGSDLSSAVITPASHNTISGLRVESQASGGACIESADPVTNFTLKNSILEPLGPNESGLYIGQAEGTFLIENNTCNGSPSTQIAMNIGSNPSGDLNVTLSGNTITTASQGVFMENQTTNSTVIATIQNNTISDVAEAIVAQNSSKASAVYHINNNTFTGVSNHYTYLYTEGGILCAQVQDNTGSGGAVYQFIQTGSSVFNLEPFIGNTPDTYSSAGIITSVSQNTCE